MRSRKTFAAWVSAVVMAGATVAGTASTATAKGGEVGGWGNTYLLTDGFGGQPNHELSYGGVYDEMYVGDWDGDGTDSLAYRRGSTFYVRNTNTTGRPQNVFAYGRSGDVVLVGDWDGDGTDTFAVRRGNEYHVKNSLSGGWADVAFDYGRDRDTVLVGNWDGMGADTFAVRRGNEYHVKNSLSGGWADEVAKYGRATDVVLVGDWDGDDADTFTVRRENEYHIANEIRGGNADRMVHYGTTADTSLVGDWNGDGVDTFGLRRGTGVPPQVQGAAAYTEQREELTDLLNDYRRQHDAAPLRRDAGLDALAQARAAQAAENRSLAHPENLKGLMGSEWLVGSEIIVRHTWPGGMTTDELLSHLHHWWRGSPVHDANMLRKAWNGRYTVTNVGTGFYVNGAGQAYAVHIFGAQS